MSDAYSEMTVGGACQCISKYRTCGGFVVEFVAWFVSNGKYVSVAERQEAVNCYRRLSY